MKYTGFVINVMTLQLKSSAILVNQMLHPVLYLLIHTNMLIQLKMLVASLSNYLRVQAQIQKLVDHVNVQLDNRLREFETKMDHKFGNAPLIQEQQMIANPNPKTSGDSNWNITTHVIDEYRDRESRKLNLILHNVPESQSGDNSARKAHDTNFVSDIANKIQAGKIDVTNVSRLGMKINNKNRLMKVQVANLSQKKSLLTNAKKLKQCSGDFQNIYLTPDLSYNERQANRTL